MSSLQSNTGSVVWTRVDAKFGILCVWGKCLKCITFIVDIYICGLGASGTMWQ